VKVVAGGRSPICRKGEQELAALVYAGCRRRPAASRIAVFNCAHKSRGQAAPPDETRLKQCSNPIVQNSTAVASDQPCEKETIMIQVGSKEEVALVLALFGTHTQPIRTPRPKSSRG